MTDRRIAVGKSRRMENGMEAMHRRANTRKLDVVKAWFFSSLFLKKNGYLEFLRDTCIL